MDIEVPDEFSALRDRVGAGRMTRDDVVIVQGLYRPGFVSQQGVARIIQVDRFMLINEMRRVGASWTRSTKGRHARGDTRPRDTLLEGDIPVEGRGDIDEGPEEQISGADVDDEMQFEDQSTRGTESDVVQGLVGG